MALAYNTDNEYCMFFDNSIIPPIIIPHIEGKMCITYRDSIIPKLIYVEDDHLYVDNKKEHKVCNIKKLIGSRYTFTCIFDDYIEIKYYDQIRSFKIKNVSNILSNHLIYVQGMLDTVYFTRHNRVFKFIVNAEYEILKDFNIQYVWSHSNGIICFISDNILYSYNIDTNKALKFSLYQIKEINNHTLIKYINFVTIFLHDNIFKLDLLDKYNDIKLDEIDEIESNDVSIIITAKNKRVLYSNALINGLLFDGYLNKQIQLKSARSSLPISTV